MSTEVNFDGLVGPTHHYGALAEGNIASQSHGLTASNPREAALQGLAKMRALVDMGYHQGIIAPQERPHVATLRRLGFTGTDARVLETAAQTAPALLSQVSSSASMWVANAATVTPGADTLDGRVHFTPANMATSFHRSIEHPATERLLKAMFADEDYFAHHPALPAVAALGDEGAANHTRLCHTHGEPGIGFFVYGQYGLDRTRPAPRRYPARQTREASQAIARQHGIKEERTVFAQQHPDAIDAGVFHNDVIAVGSRRTLFYHQQAFIDTDRVIDDLNRAMAQVGTSLVPIEVPTSEVSLEDAVATYLFNSQLLDIPEGGQRLVVPSECMEVPSVRTWLDNLVASDGPINDVRVFNLGQSMQNGGGPACLRLRVVLNNLQRQAVTPGVMMTPDRLDQLEDWVRRHYRDHLVAADLADPALLSESRYALDELTGLLQLGNVYGFQRG
ncbi:N-succinylarginine dihydrolase [Larsenimonas rhizosphaerae]|uniref:N-succinylarginine dihydrolase n=1 Tax=Larsenimonas rhizosphaerae TaxID=2944682 RepID=UPI00254970D3|nr:N-succinylarginine dihydrolase [Larsenimonas rhizosphaerae]